MDPLTGLIISATIEALTLGIKAFESTHADPTPEEIAQLNSARKKLVALADALDS